MSNGKNRGKRGDHMRIAGLQKLTLLDYPGQVACTVFTCGCNLRCPFCHNAALVLPERMEDGERMEDVLAFLEKRRGVLDGVAVTGGEPLLHDDLPDFLRAVRAMGYKIKLDTNGTLPDRLRAVLEEGLADRVAMDVKNAPKLWAETAGAPVDMGALARSRDLLLGGAAEAYEFRTTVVRGLHTAESLLGAARWIEGAREYYLQQFRDTGDLLAADGLGAFTDEEMRVLCETVRSVVPTAALRGVN